MRRVVITGLGIVSCLGNNQEEVHKSLVNSKSGISYAEDIFENRHGKLLAPVLFYNCKDIVNITFGSSISRIGTLFNTYQVKILNERVYVSDNLVANGIHVPFTINSNDTEQDLTTYQIQFLTNSQLNMLLLWCL